MIDLGNVVAVVHPALSSEVHIAEIISRARDVIDPFGQPKAGRNPGGEVARSRGCMQVPERQHFSTIGCVEKVTGPTLALGRWIRNNFLEFKAARFGIETVRCFEISGRNRDVMVSHGSSLVDRRSRPLPLE